jgi:hypothetical protein
LGYFVAHVITSLHQPPSSTLHKKRPPANPPNTQPPTPTYRQGDNPPIGIILTREKNELLMKYAMHGMSAKLFVQKYQLYLPNEAELRREIEKAYN